LQRLGVPEQLPFRHWAPEVHGSPVLSRQAVPAALQVVVTMSAQPVVVPAVHVVAQAVALAQMRPPPQAAAVGMVQAPVPSQLLAGVNRLVIVLHDAAAHAVDEAQQSTLQTPGDAH
jgi:hypothetical protein